MGKDKLRRFAENESFPLLYQPSFDEVFRKQYYLQSLWGEKVFGNNRDIVLELGCGRGEYTVALSAKYPQKNFIGIDIKGARLWRGAKTAVEEERQNVAFLRTRIEFLEGIFGPEEISEIWLTFPDPQLHRENKRLTAPHFLDLYLKFLRPGALIHLKTDSLFLHQYTIETLSLDKRFTILDARDDIYGRGDLAEDHILQVKTHYEEGYLADNKAITYLCFAYKQ